MNTEDIAKRAHGIWEMAGRPQGKAVDHWLQAESELSEVECAPSGGEPPASAPNILQAKKASRPARRSTR